jgi:hypothetical protein
MAMKLEHKGNKVGAVRSWVWTRAKEFAYTMME